MQLDHMSFLKYVLQFFLNWVLVIIILVIYQELFIRTLSGHPAFHHAPAIFIGLFNGWVPSILTALPVVFSNKIKYFTLSIFLAFISTIFIIDPFGIWY